MDSGLWAARCYDGVDWKEVERDSTRIYRTRHGSWSLVFSMMGSVVLGAAGNLLYAATRPYIQRRMSALQEIPDDERQAYGENVRNVIPMFREADIFVGQRQPWARKKLNDAGRELESRLEAETSISSGNIRAIREAVGSLDGAEQSLDDLGIPDLETVAADDASVYDTLENVGSLSANELFQTLDLIVSANLAMEEEEPENLVVSEQTGVDFSSDLVSVGGPIANFYTRNVMYDTRDGPDFSLPYRFDLNPPGVQDDLTEYPPQKLREIGLADDRELGRRPNWCLVDEGGETLDIQGDQSRPNWRDGNWMTDYFTVAKVPNVHPDAPPLHRADTKRVLILAGCHGFGTRAALEALKSGDILETIESEVNDGYFQLIGRVKRGDGPEITPNDIEIPSEYLRQIDVE